MADGSINIDLLLNDQTDKTWSEFKSKAETAGKSGYDKFKDAFKGDPLVAKLETKANKAGIKNFRELLNQLPKEKQTELLTKAEKGEVINYEKLLREIPSKITSQVELNDNASTGLRSLKNQAEEVGDKFHRLKDIAIGTFVGSTISAGVRTVAGFISGLGQEALNSSDALQKFKSTMQLGGFGEDEIDKATKQVKKYADDTVYDLNTVSNTTAQLAANGVKDYMGLTEAAGNLNAQAGGNADTFKSVAMVLTQTAGAGKLTTENWNQMADAIPGASGVLQKALKENGAFTGNFRDAMADGQITADEFNDALTKLGSNDAAKKAATSTNTFEGAWGSLEANVVSGLDNMINKIGKKNLTGIINQLADVSTSAFGTMGKAVGNVIQFIEKNKNTIVAVFGGIKDVVVQVFGLIGNALSLFSISFKANVLGAVSDGKVGEKVNGIQKAFDGLVEAIKPIASAVGGFVGVLAGGVVSTIVKVVQGIADGFVNVGNSADKSKKKLDFTAIFGIIIKLSQSLNDVFTVLGEIAKPLGEIIGSIASGAFEAFSDIIGLIVDGLKHLSGQAKEASDKTNPLAKGLESVAKHKKALEAVGLAVGAIATAMIAVKGVVGVFKLISDGITTVRIATMLMTDVWKALNLVLKANIFVIIITAIVALGVAFYELYKHNKKFKKFVDDCVDAAADFFKGIGKWFGQATKAVGKFFKGLGKWFGNIGKSIGSGSNAISKWFDGLIKGFVKGWNKFVNATVKLAKVFGEILLYALAVPVGLVIVITKPLVEPLKKIFNSLIKWIKKAWSGTVKFLSKIWEPVAKTWNKAWKLIQKAFEFVWKILSKFIENEFNFWKKLFTVTLNFITKAWNKAWNAVSKTFESIWNGIKKFFKPIIEWLSNVISDTLKAIKKIWNKTWDSISDFFSDTWNGIKKFGSKAVNSLKDTFDDVLGKIGKSFGNTWTGVKNGFSDMWDGMKKLAGDGINAVIKIPNAGIDGINGLIHDFGGPKNALGKIPKVKFANGTGAINQLTHAILNDGNDSPETGNKETLIHPNGKMEIVQGRNTERLLLPGTEVLNASETAMLMGMSGVKHFANGTGFLGSIWDGVQDVAGTVGNVASSAWDGIKNATEKYTKMFDFITNAVAHPVKTLENVFNPKSSSKLGNMMSGLATGSFKHVENQATDWWKSLWSLAGDEASGGGGASELLSNAVKYGTGKPYVWGATGPDSFDCSGLVQYTLKQMGKSFPHYSGDQFNASNSVGTPKSGDLAFFGGGGSQHVGIYAGNGKMFSAMSPSSNPNIGYANISNWSEKLAGYHRVPGLKSDDEKKSSGNSMTSLIRSQVGGMFDWIKKFIAPTQESSSEPAGDGVSRWTSDVKKALSKLGLSSSSSMVNKVLKQIQTESSGNAKAIGGNDGLADGNATGLMQVKPGTFKAYAVDGHNNIMNGYDNILAGLNYAKHRYGSDLSFLGQGHGYANGGRTNGIGVVGEVQGEDEWVTNSNRPTADSTIIGSIKETAQKQPNSFAAKLAGVINGAKSGMQAITSQQPIIAGSSAMQSTNGGIDLSGDVHMTVQLDSGEIARATYPKIKVLQNQEIQMKGQVTGNTYVY